MRAYPSSFGPAVSSPFRDRCAPVVEGVSVNPAAPTLQSPLTLPCGAILKNRLLKSAMSEILGTAEHGASPLLPRLYQRWAEGGIGLAITGNVMIDRRALGEPANVVIEDDRDLEALSAWATAGTANGAACWMQLNHPGKQSPRFLSPETVSPSAIGFGPALSKGFAVPRALTEPEILDLIARFGRAAAVAKTAGFTGVQIHGAHGYLVSQFLSPRHNSREDDWGGSLENRARFALEVYKEIRRQVGPEFPVGIKINSADFQKGGFSEEDSAGVISSLSQAGMDLIEVSGGTYEAPAMTGRKVAESTRAREGYFLDFVGKVREAVAAPMAVTGGFRSLEGMQGALDAGATDMIGLARPMAVMPELPNRLLAGESPEIPIRRLSTGFKAVDAIATLDITWYENQLHRMGSGQDPLPGMGAWRSFLTTGWRLGSQSLLARRAKA